MTMLEVVGPGYALPDGMIAEWRSGGTVADVTKRVITVVAVPYDEDAECCDPSGREYVESFDRHAFRGIEKRTNRIPVNRDHDNRRLVGKVAVFHPNRREGLVSELRMSPDVPLADETLALARDDVLSASISFGVKDDGVVWSDRGRRRRVVTAFLEHIALVPDPAYAGATVLDVRHRGDVAPTPATVADTPRLQQALAVIAGRELRSRFNID